jgi:hypothetical protein
MGRLPTSHVCIAVATLFTIGEKMERAVQRQSIKSEQIMMNPLQGVGEMSCYRKRGTVRLGRGRQGADRKRGTVRLRRGRQGADRKRGTVRLGRGRQGADKKSGNVRLGRGRQGADRKRDIGGELMK